MDTLITRAVGSHIYVNKLNFDFPDVVIYFDIDHDQQWNLNCGATVGGELR